MKWFYTKGATYNELGIPHRRAYLLVGPPGTGKSRLIGDLISIFPEVRSTMITFKTPSEGCSLTTILADAALKPQMIISEDIDRIPTFCSDVPTDIDKSSYLSFGDAINFIDGVNTPNNTIFIFTTNHPEKLDPVLLRNGRIDWIINIDPMDRDQIIRMAERFEVELTEYEINKLIQEKTTGAMLQDKLVKLSPKLKLHHNEPAPLTLVKG